MSKIQERFLRRRQQHQQSRRLERSVYASIYQRLARLVPIVLPCAGRLQAFPFERDYHTIQAKLAPSCVFAFETAFEIRTGRRVLNGRDMHAYVTSLPPWLEQPLMPTPSLQPVFERAPCIFLIEVPTLPTWLEVNGLRVVTTEVLLRQYLGTIGHRFDLLAVVLHHLDATDSQ